MQITLREGDDDAGLVEFVIDRLVQCRDGRDTQVEVVDIGAQQKREGIVAEALEAYDWMWIIEDVFVLLRRLPHERVGLVLKPDLVAIKDAGGDKDSFTGLIQKAKDAGAGKVVLMSEKVENLQAGAEAAGDARPLLYAANKDNVEALGNLAKDKNVPLAVKGAGLDEVMELTTKLTEMGLKDLVIDSGSRELQSVFTDQVGIRRGALIGGERALGFPTITFPCEMTKDPMEEALVASTMIGKYAGNAVLSDLQGESLFPLLVQRMNIFTDPQRPMATSEGIYEISAPPGSYRIDGYRLDSANANEILGGKTDYPYNPHSTGIIKLETGKTTRALDLKYVIPVGNISPKGEFSLSEPVNISWDPYPGAIKVKRFRSRWSCPVRVSLRQGAEHDHRLERSPYIVLELEAVSNQAQ